MTTEETKKLVDKAIAIINKKIEYGKKQGWKSVSVLPRTGMYVDHKVSFNFGYDNEIFDRADCSDAKMFFRLLREGLQPYGYIVESDDVYRADMWWTPAFSKVSKVSYIEKPCKEFETLAKYVKKYAGIDLPTYGIYNVRMFGKRGVLDTETEERNYLCHRPEKCKRILEYLREHRGAKDSLSVKFRLEEYCEDRDISIRLETECYGHKETVLDVTIKTPGGKVKVNETYYL